MKFNFLCTNAARLSLQNIYLVYTRNIIDNSAMMQQKAFNAGAKSCTAGDAEDVDKAIFKKAFEELRWRFHYLEAMKSVEKPEDNITFHILG